MLDILGVVSIVAKFLLYISVLTAAGTALVVPIFGLSQMKRFTVIAILVALLASLTLYGIDAILLTGDLSGLTDPEILLLLSEASSGKAFYIRLTGLSLLFTGLLVNGLGKWISVIGALISLYSFTQVGHINDHDSLLVSLSLYVHLLTAALWIGILWPLRNMALYGADISITARIAHQFGRLAMAFVPALILAGAYMAWVSFESLADLIFTGYGQTLLVKITSVSTLLVLAAFNKLRFVPQLREGNILAARNLARTIKAECSLVAIVLIATAVLTTVSELP